MLEQKDLDAIAQIVDARATKSEAFLLDEIDRMKNSMKSKIDTLSKNIEELTQYYRITRLESDNTALLLQIAVLSNE